MWTSVATVLGTFAFIALAAALMGPTDKEDQDQ